MADARPVVVVSPYRGEYGPPRSAVDVCRALGAAGWPTVCVVPPGTRTVATLREMGTEVVTMECVSTVPRSLDPRRLGRFAAEHLRAATDLAALAAARGACAVYSVSEAMLCGGFAARRLGVPSISHALGMSIGSPRPAAAAYIRLLRSTTDHFVACSAAVAEMLQRHGVDAMDISVVHNGVETAAIRTAAEEHRPELPDGPRVGMVAAYDPRKGHELFVEAAALIAARHPDARFCILGGAIDGAHESRRFEQQVLELIRRRGLAHMFEMVGYVPQPQVFGWIGAMDVVVVPSRTEAFAHAVLEAMACARPVVATEIEGNLDAFVDGHSGEFTAPDPARMAAAVSRLLADPERAARMGEQARERVARFFDVAVTLPSLGYAVKRTVTG
jgi:glycosyltransferase involved in cell wall biosynthesis